MHNGRDPAGCSGKHPYTTPAQAHRVARKYAGVVVYRCQGCGHWHVGTPKGSEHCRPHKRRRK